MSTSLTELKELRALLVEARRKCVKLSIKNPRDIGQWGQDVFVLQDRIEAVDRAITDEENQAGT